MGKYDDIIHLPRPQFGRRAKMSLADRAAQFSPFAALTGYDAIIQETGRLTDECTELTESAREDLDRQLRVIVEELENEPRIAVTWFCPDSYKDGGEYRKMQGNVKKLDAYERQLTLTDGTVIPIGRIKFLELL